MTWALNRQSAELPADAAALLPDGLTGLTPHIGSSLPATIRDVVLGHYSSGFNVMFIWVAALYFVAMALTLLPEDIQIPKRGLSPTIP